MTGLGAALVALSVLFNWAQPHVGAGESKVGIVLIPAALGTAVLLTVVSSRGVAWPFLYTRALGACALVATLWAVLDVARPANVGALVAGIGGALIIGGSAAGLSGHAEATAPRRLG
jgi:hypothetical protein